MNERALVVAQVMARVRAQGVEMGGVQVMEGMRVERVRGLAQVLEGMREKRIWGVAQMMEGMSMRKACGSALLLSKGSLFLPFFSSLFRFKLPLFAGRHSPGSAPREQGQAHRGCAAQLW